MNESLTSFIEEVTGESHLRVEDDLGGGFVRLRRAEAERRQAQHDIRCTEDIIIELLRNSHDAGARNIFLALSREENIRRICIIDDGEGIPHDMHEVVFEPRVTSKFETIHMDRWGVHGRGMALFSIASNTSIAKVLDSAPGLGTAIFVEYNLDALPEKTDQSTMPSLTLNEAGEQLIRGPHNINRTVAEFAFEQRESCNVFYGSTTDIVATLYLFGQSTVTKSIRAFCEHPEELPLVKRLCTAGDPKTLASISATMGLSISERSARRILDGEIVALADTVETNQNKRIEEVKVLSKKPTDIRKLLMKDPRGLKIHETDMEEFKEKLTKAYQQLAEAYYLESAVEPEVKLYSDSIHIRISFSKLS